MQTITFHSPALAAEEKKPRRYVLCLEMVETILQDFFPEKQSYTSLFQQLGEIAYCIDTHLDDLDAEQKEILLTGFPDFFDSLGETVDETSFNDKLRHFAYQVGTTLYPYSWATTLYQFYCHCARHELLPRLKIFSITIIRSAILKSRAVNAGELLRSMKLEGAASVHFLLLLLEKENIISRENKKFDRLQNYLGRLEIMLNIADALYDYKRDKRSGTISSVIGKSFHIILSLSFSRALFITVTRNPIFFFKHCFVFTGRCLRANIF